MKISGRSLTRLAATCLCVLSATVLRGHLDRARGGLELERGLDAAAVAESRPAARVLVATAGLGVFRALALDYLWIRAIRLQESGRFFESAALIKLITRIEPRLPAVWTFQASTLAYDITPALPPRERFPWVLEAIRLLRDDALRRNAGDASIHFWLAFIFQHKIGLDFDDAGVLYRSRLAAEFDVDPDSPRGREVLRRWRIEPRILGAIEEQWALRRLDFRAAESHALYWAQQGLDAVSAWGDPLSRRGLFHVVRGSVFQLFTGGLAVKAPFTDLYAFVPDPGTTGAVLRVLELMRERYRASPAALALTEEASLQFQGKRIFFLYLRGREDEARAAFEESRERIAPEARSLEDFLVSKVGFLTVPDTAPMEDRPPPALRSISACLDAALLLETAGQEELARGFRSLSRLVLAASPEAARRPFDDFALAAARRLASRWQGTLGARLPAALLAAAEREGPSAGDLGLPECAELPFRLEILDPVRFPEAP